ncbi:TlpA family protein disulfide reductase [Candidatus Poriferisocius sp.]|uniref:TlpA family protein disulfide reductase n=1 Tax=Candidatus Poriferisocius sp. TaxID=3101276 RepID=UPI003B02AE25
MCRREAPGVEQFARNNADKLTVIGVGTQDSLGLAESFVESTGTTFTMLWDPTFESWRQLGISGQPAGMLLDGNGTIQTSWRGGIPESQVLEAVSAL